jgi:hypothetical protein
MAYLCTNLRTNSFSDPLFLHIKAEAKEFFAHPPFVLTFYKISVLYVCVESLISFIVSGRKQTWCWCSFRLKDSRFRHVLIAYYRKSGDFAVEVRAKCHSVQTNFLENWLHYSRVSVGELQTLGQHDERPVR